AHDAQQKVLGVLDITMSLAEVEAGMRASTLRLLLFALSAIAAISLMIYWLVHVIVLKPLRQIVTATQHVAAGDLTYAIPMHQRDEIGALAQSFNEMTRRLAETQRQLFQSEKLASVGRLAAGVAHEINNPLTGVLTYSSFLLKRAEDKPEIKEDLEVIVRETKRCREIVKGLLDFARQSPAEKNRVAINEVIKRSVQILANQLAKHKIQIEQQLAPDLPELEADANQLQQVLVNLIMNANDALAENGGTITVSSALLANEANVRRPHIQIQVRDTGCGIPAENLSKIFEPFFTTKGQKGNGLGLAIVWGIIEKHNGRIAVESKLDAGTTFTILLPVKSEAKIENRG
ncbi:MAG: ATP-binding protein, partial [candidate division KSB1 bacterium]